MKIKKGIGLMMLSDALAYLTDEVGVMVTKPTLIEWCRKFELGFQLSGKSSAWIVDRAKLEEFVRRLNNNNDPADNSKNKKGRRGR